MTSRDFGGTCGTSCGEVPPRKLWRLFGLRDMRDLRDFFPPRMRARAHTCVRMGKG